MANFVANSVHYKLTLSLDHRYKNTENKYQVCLIIYFKGNNWYSPLGVYIEKQHWDKGNGKILPEAKLNPNTTWYNDRIQEKYLAAKKILTFLDASDTLPLLTPSELIQRIEKKESKASFFDYLDEHIKFLRDHHQEGNAEIYTGVKRFLNKYAPERKQLRFEDITHKFLKLLEARYIDKGYSYNGLSNYLRTIRALWNKAITEGLISSDRYPFKDYKIRHVKSHKTAIKRSEMILLRDIKVKIGTASWHGHNAFFFSFYCRGMNLSDIAKLRMTNIQNGKIIYKRSKNSKPFIVSINDKALGILDLYTPDKQPNDYIFPIINELNQKDTIQRQISDFRNIINHSLKRWAKKLKITPTLSFNTARHSWATIGRDMDLSISKISEGLGHDDIRTTQIYLDDFQDGEIDEVNRLITDL